MMNPSTILVTGGAGFIGSNFVRSPLRRDPKIRVINLDLLTYAGNLESLADVARDYPDRYRFVHGDIKNGELVAGLLQGCDAPAASARTSRAEWVPDAVVHFAAESHVD